MLMEPNTLYEKRMIELLKCQTHMIHCLELELWYIHARYINIHHRVEPYVRLSRIPHLVLYYPNGDDAMVYERTKHPYRYPSTSEAQNGA
jgi:hypothetical protein